MSTFQELSNNKEKAFWFFQISGWTLFYFQHIFVFSPIKEFTFYNLSIRSAILAFGFIISIFLRYRLKRIDYLKYSFFSLVVIIFFSSLICSTIWYVGGAIFYESMKYSFISFRDASFADIIVGIARDNVVFIGWSGLYFGIKFWMEWVSQKKKTDSALLLARNAQLEMLKYQLNPHFLFNTLSSLRALTSNENVKAKEMITKISEFLRYTLIEINSNEVTLSKEIEVIKNYLDIEKVRFEDELDVVFNIDHNTEVYQVPIFLIHPLVENAIKHGMQTSPIPLRIIITAKMIDARLNISVFNTGKWIERKGNDSTRRGLENIKRRLQIYSPNEHEFQVIKNDDSVQVNLSLKKELNRN
jgi:hypothetical protein